MLFLNEHLKKGINALRIQQELNRHVKWWIMNWDRNFETEDAHLKQLINFQFFYFLLLIHAKQR